MARTALLVSEQRMKQWTGLDENVRTEDIRVYIVQAQDIYVQDTLGTKFFNSLKNAIINSTLTSNEETLLKDYVGPMLMQYALYLMLPHIKYKIVDKGILSGTSEETQATSLDELKYLRESTLNTAQFYNERVIEYFRDNPGMFPDYETPGTDGMYPNKQTPYFSGLVTQVPKRRSYYDQKCDDCGIIEGPAIED
jgi:hypothetical protein